MSMRVLLENQEITKYQFGYDGPNLLGFDTLEEVYFDVFEIKSKDYQIIKEKKESKNGLPIVELDVTVDNILYKGIKFELTKENVIRINQNSLNRRNSIILEKKKPVLNNHKNILIKEHNIVAPKPMDPTKKALKDLVVKESKEGLINNLIKENVERLFKQLLVDEPTDRNVFRFFEGFTEKFNKQYIEIAEKIARREAMRAMEGGGGTNAVQYSNGGSMNGKLIINDDLEVTGTIYGTLSGGGGGGVVDKKTFIIGDGINSEFVLNHSLNTYDVIVQIYDNSTKESVNAFIKNISPNETLIKFSQIIGVDSYRVVII
jgi:hypothetical protein